MVRHSLLWLTLFILIFTGSASAAVPADEPAWELIVPGIEFYEFQLPDPNNAFVLRMDRNNPTVTLESSIAQGKLSDGREAVSGMFARYDQALNNWGVSANPPNWGMRNQVIAGINGSYFDLVSGIPQGGQVQAGWYAKRFDKLGGWSGFAWKLDRSAFIGKCVDNLPTNQFITFTNTGATQQITHVNYSRGSKDLVLFTPQYNSQTGTSDSGTEVIVEMTRPAMIMPEPAYASGVVRQIRENMGNSLIPFNSIVLSASGTAAQTLLNNVQVGSEIRVSQEITSYEYDCEAPYELSWTKTYASVQGAYFFLDNGQIREFPDDPGATNRRPRTAIAFNDQYIYFVVVDGRDAYHSVGMTITELATFARDTLGAVSGVAQDGGGSSTMVINGHVVNNTYCNIYTCMGNYTTYLPILTRNSHKEGFVEAPQSSVVVSEAGTERTVANGMLMVVVQPAVYSTAFMPADQVTAVSDTDIRLGPGTNYVTITTLPAGTQGSILEQMNGLNGVLAKSTYWWYVNLGGVEGWVPEGDLASQK